MNAAQTDNGMTSLHYASTRGHLELASLLLEKGANVDAATTDEGYTALMRATERGHVNTVQLLLASGANKDLMNARGKTALMLAASSEVKRALK